MTENHAAQPGLTDDEIEALAKKHIAPHADRLEAIMTNPVPYQQTEQFRRVKALIADALSKLRAEGVQAGDAMQWPTMPESKGQSPVLFEDGYAEGWAKCMDECRRAVSAASAPVAPQACPTDVCQAAKADGVLCANDECDRASGVRSASAPVAGERHGDSHIGDAAPQASEAVRNEALYLLREARALLPMFATAEAIGDWSEKVNRFAAGDVIDIPPQADKDGGDCAKGAGDVHFIAGTIVTHLNGPLDPAGVMAAARAITAWAHRQHPRTDGGGRE